MVLEDDMLILLDLAKMLEENGHEVASASTSIEEAMEFLDKDRPDVALLDIRLGHGVTSFVVAERLKAMNCPFMFVTAYDDQTIDVPKPFRDTPWVSKPFDDGKLRAVFDTMAVP